jgi:hypothetical protein
VTQKLLELHCRPKQTLTHPRGVAEEEEDHAIFFPIESVAAVRVGVVVVSFPFSGVLGLWLGVGGRWVLCRRLSADGTAARRPVDPYRTLGVGSVFTLLVRPPPALPAFPFLLLLLL